MYIDLIIEKTLKESKLKRVRIKVDPSELAVFGYENVSSFEGYILEEGLATVRVFLVGVPKGIDPIQTVDKKHVTTVEPPPIPPKFLEFKSRILQQLEKQGIQKDSPQYTQIQNCNNPEFIDSYLRELKLDDKKIAELYKSVYLSENIFTKIATGMAKQKIKNELTDNNDTLGQKIGKGIKALADNPITKIASAGVNAVAALPGLVVGKNNILKRIVKFSRSFDFNDLINLNKLNPIFVGEKEEVKKDDEVATKFGDVHIIGKVVEETKTGWNIKALQPKKYKNMVFRLDHSILGPNAGKGTIYFKDEKYSVKVELSQGKVLLTVIRDLDEVPDSSEDVSRRLKTKTIDTPATPTFTISEKEKQDQIRTQVVAALTQTFGEKKPGNYSRLLNELSASILKEKGRERVMVDKLIDVIAQTNEEISKDKEKTPTTDFTNKTYNKLVNKLEKAGFRGITA